MCCEEKVCECCGVVHGRVFVTGPRASISVDRWTAVSLTASPSTFTSPRKPEHEPQFTCKSQK